MTAKRIFKQLFEEFAGSNRITHNKRSASQSADFKGSNALCVSRGASQGKVGVGIRTKENTPIDPSLILVWVSVDPQGGLEASLSPLLEGHPEKPLVDAFLARAEKLEKALTS